jgi:hypothetical protein
MEWRTAVAKAAGWPSDPHPMHGHDHYLIDDNGLIEIRAKEKTLRLLDSEKTRLEHTYWQWFNIIAPLLSMMIFGLANNIYRKRKYQTR